VELLGPYGLEKGILKLSYNLSTLSTGVITSYALYIFIGLIFYFCLLNYFQANILLLLLFTIFSSFILIF
jgi:NADH-ubiquinone oxidoreductase chain 5